MKVIGPRTLAFFFLFVSITPAWAFGPHSTTATTEGVELPRGIPAYQDFVSPVFYLSFTRRDVIPLSQESEVIEVEGTSAKTRIFLPIGYFLGLSPTSGVSFDVMDRSIEKAIADAQTRYGVRTLYDVRIDRNLFSILGIYNRTTTIIHAKGIR
jgi:hypothetical protein